MPDIIDLSSDDEDCSKNQDSKSAAGGQSKDSSSISRPRIELPSCTGDENISSHKLEAKQEPQKNCSNIRQENKNGRVAPEHVSTASFDLQHQNCLHPSVQVTTNGSVQMEPGTPSFIGFETSNPSQEPMSNGRFSRHFWRAGEFQGKPSRKNAIQGAMDHVRVHPKFLHSNATSHKWALGAIAELLDNAIDEVHNGSTFVKVDRIVNPRDNSPALLVQDNGGGMDPDCLRHCMSLGYSQKNTNTMIGQYGNGFKTSTMRLGADVIVFSRCFRNGFVTQSIGLLSYTFLRETGHEDTIVPMVDFELLANTKQPRRLLRSTEASWSSNLDTIMQWSPYVSEDELLQQFEDLSSHGTKIVVYNLWLNDDGVLELDFDSDETDIQLRGTNKQEKPDKLQSQLTQQHISNRLRYSLRAYASMLYLQMPTNFQIILRGTPVEHHSIADDLKFPEYIIYKPQVGGSVKDFGYKEVSVITIIGFTKEAPMVNVHGFNVYHKNRLIMPFWKVLQENSSRGRGVVGVLEANFIEPAHDKQDFEKTALLLRLETRLKQMTIEYWNLHCELIGYQRNTPRNRQSLDAGSFGAAIPITAHPSIVALPHPFATAGISGLASRGPGISSFQNQQSVHCGPGIREPEVVQDASIAHERAQDIPESGVHRQSSESITEQKPSSSTQAQKNGVPGSQIELKSSPVLESLNVSSPGTSRKESEDNIKYSALGVLHDRSHPNSTSAQLSRSSECVTFRTRDNHVELAENGPLRVKTEFCEDNAFKRKIIDLDHPFHPENVKRQREDYLTGSDIDQKDKNQGENGQVNVGRQTEQNHLLVSDASRENVLKIVEENKQLKSRCVEYERREKELEELVDQLERELLQSKTKYIELLRKIDD